MHTLLEDKDNGKWAKRDPRMVNKIPVLTLRGHSSFFLASSLLISESGPPNLYINTSATCSVILSTPASEGVGTSSSPGTVAGPFPAAPVVPLPCRP